MTSCKESCVNMVPLSPSKSLAVLDSPFLGRCEMTQCLCDEMTGGGIFHFNIFRRRLPKNNRNRGKGNCVRGGLPHLNYLCAHLLEWCKEAPGLVFMLFVCLTTLVFRENINK